jgi:hypothetical protein
VLHPVAIKTSECAIDHEQNASTSIGAYVGSDRNIISPFLAAGGDVGAREIGEHKYFGLAPMYIRCRSSSLAPGNPGI